jgi:hypothetical protein
MTKPIKPYRTAKNADLCNAFSPIWGAIYGCLGRTKRFRMKKNHQYGVHAPAQRPEFICDVCLAVRQAEAAHYVGVGMSGLKRHAASQAHQADMRAAREAAGVVDYMTADYYRDDNGAPRVK